MAEKNKYTKLKMNRDKVFMSLTRNSGNDHF